MGGDSGGMRLTASLAIVVAATCCAPAAAQTSGGGAAAAVWTDVVAPGGVARVAQASTSIRRRRRPSSCRRSRACSTPRPKAAAKTRASASRGFTPGPAPSGPPAPKTPWCRSRSGRTRGAPSSAAISGPATSSRRSWSIAARRSSPAASPPWTSHAALLRLDPAALARLDADDAAVFAGFGRSLRIHDGRIVLPGGDAARPLWEAVAGVPPDPPERFLEALYEKDQGRLAYFFDSIASLDAPRQRYALGTWIADAGVRLERFERLYRTVAGLVRRWQPADRPFSRLRADLALGLAAVAVEPSGVPSAPAWTPLWRRVFARNDLPSASERDLGSVARAAPVDAASLMSFLLVVRARRPRRAARDARVRPARVRRRRGRAGAGRARRPAGTPAVSALVTAYERTRHHRPGRLRRGGPHRRASERDGLPRRGAGARRVPGRARADRPAARAPRAGRGGRRAAGRASRRAGGRSPPGLSRRRRPLAR